MTDPVRDLERLDVTPYFKPGRRRFDRADAKRRYLAGETTPQIAKSYGVTSQAVARALKGMGVRLIPHWERAVLAGKTSFPHLEKANAERKARTHCPHGHEYTPENTRFSRGLRHCRECERAQNRAWKRRNWERIQATRPPRVPKTPVWVPCAGCGEKRLMAPLQPGQERRCRSCRMLQRRGTGEFRFCMCGKHFYAKRRPTGKLAEWCSVACRVEYGGYKDMGRKLSAARGGDGNPAYKHGRRIDIQIPGWKVKEKGESCCRNCGAGRAAGRLELHHAVPRSKARHARADLRNGIPLCLDCHRGWHSKNVVIHRDVFTADEWAFISTIALTGERIEAWLDKHYPPRDLVVAA